jgi:hypothetical protein
MYQPGRHSLGAESFFGDTVDMAPSIILPQLVPKDAIIIGSFVPSIDYPFPDSEYPKCKNPPQLVITPRESYTGIHGTDFRSGFGSALTSLLSAGFSKRAKTNIRVVSDCVKTYYLDKSDVWFDEATEIPDTRRWAERKYDRGYDIYMIVGYHTVTDARIVLESITGEAAGGQIKLPVGLSLAAAGVILPLGDLVDPRVSGHLQSSNTARSQFIAPGEQVCAVQYRKVCHRWLSSKDIGKSRLSKVSNVSWWYSVERSRDEVDGVDDIIEVELMEVDMDAQWDKEEVGDDVLFLRSSIEAQT